MTWVAALLALGAVAAPTGAETPYDGFARSVEAELGVQARTYTGPGPHPCAVVRIGAAGLPSVAVVLEPDGPEPAPEDVVARLDALALGYAVEAGDAQFALELVVPEADTGDASGVAFDRNFPSQWGLARADSPRSAGHYPGARADVASVVDWLLDRRRASCIGVVAVGPERATSAPAGAKAPPGSLRLFVEEGLGRGFQAVGEPLAVMSAAASVHAAAPRFTLEPASVQRVGPTSWVVDATLHASRGAARRTPGAERGGAVPCELSFAVRGHPRAFAACAVEDASGVLRVRSVRRGSARFDLPPGARRVRLVLDHPELTGEEELVLHLKSVGAVGARVSVPLTTLQPPHESPSEPPELR
ncbi:MAG: hypothetical protein AAFP86_18855 [Planctomycetota bacterium]